MATSKHGRIHKHLCNVVPIVWGSLRLTPIKLYHSQVFPLLVWDPHLVKLEQQLEKVQLFATRIASKQWSESANTLNSHFNLPSLCLRRTNVKFLYLYKLVNGYMSCLYGLLVFLTKSSLLQELQLFSIHFL